MGGLWCGRARMGDEPGEWLGRRHVSGILRNLQSEGRKWRERSVIWPGCRLRSAECATYAGHDAVHGGVGGVPRWRTYPESGGIRKALLATAAGGRAERLGWIGAGWSGLDWRGRMRDASGRRGPAIDFDAAGGIDLSRLER